jgi:hypothetical protein
MRNPVLKRMDISLEEYRQTVRSFLAPHRLELLKKRENWVRRAERWIGGYLIRGDQVDIDRIAPRLELVTSARQHEIWRYCRLWGSIPYNRGCGRLLRYLLRDDGQPGSPLMGIMALSSPILICKPRDQWIGWQYPEDVDVKRRRLLACMDLTVSMAVPPYNHLTAGKLICLAAISNEVRRDYGDKFGAVETPTKLREGRLALITTTSLYGSSVQYNRIRIDGRAAYKLVGYTTGFGNSHLTEQEFAEMEEYLSDAGKPIAKGWGTGRSYRLRVYTAYARLRQHDKQAPAHTHSRSVYVAPLAANAREFLRGLDEELAPYDCQFEDLVEDWRLRWLAGRASKQDVLDRFRATDPASILLGHELSQMASCGAPSDIALGRA